VLIQSIQKPDNHDGYTNRFVIPHRLIVRESSMYTPGKK
jgi:hypothetical protein